jgi:hypothetical protein
VVNQSFTLFSSAVLTATANLPNSATQDAGAIILQGRTVGFSGTFDIEGKSHEDAAQWAVLPYYVVGVGPLALAVAQLSFTTNTGNPVYILPVVMPLMRVVMTRSAGNVSLYGWATKIPPFVQFAGA